MFRRMSNRVLDHIDTVDRATMTPNNNATMTIHTTNLIQGSTFNVLPQEEPVITKVILNNVDNAIFLAKGSAKSAIMVNVKVKCEGEVLNYRTVEACLVGNEK